ncbi:MAG: alpha/beta hydrolase [Pseudomonadota bacterium]
MRTDTLYPANTAQSLAPVSPLSLLDTVWIHGGGLAGDTWRHITARYPRARTPDLPGHGHAPAPALPRVELYADALAASVPSGAVLIGHSLGGMVAMELAARQSPQITALILIETVPTLRDRATSRLTAQLVKNLFRHAPRSLLAWMAGLGACDRTRSELRRQLMRMDKASIATALTASARYDGRYRLPQITVPTLVVVGQDQTATHHGAALIADRIAGAEVATLPGGHMLHTDNPSGLRCVIEDFLRRTVLNHSRCLGGADTQGALTRRQRNP